MSRLKIRSFASSPGHTPILLLARLLCSLLPVDGAGEADTWPRILVGTATLSAMTVMRLLVSAPLLLVGTLLALYGLFALAFNDRGGATPGRFLLLAWATATTAKRLGQGALPARLAGTV